MLYIVESEKILKLRLFINAITILLLSYGFGNIAIGDEGDENIVRNRNEIYKITKEASETLDGQLLEKLKSYPNDLVLERLVHSVRNWNKYPQYSELAQRAASMIVNTPDWEKYYINRITQLTPDHQSGETSSGSLK